MELIQGFEKIMGETVNMALATSVDNVPNVRVVTFAYDKNKAGRLFFTTFKGNKKIEEFEKNAQVACMPLPENLEAGVQVRIFGHVKQSELDLQEVVSMIEKKNSDDAATIKDGGPMLNVYEVCFEEAFVTLGMSEAQSICF